MKLKIRSRTLCPDLTLYAEDFVKQAVEAALQVIF